MKNPSKRDVVEQWWDELERLGRILGQVGPDEVCCEGLSQRQTAILRILVSSEGARLSDLAALSGITPSAMTRVLEKLEARGLVERVRGAQTDGRAAMVRITAEGRKTRKQIDELMRQRAEQILRTIPEKQRKYSTYRFADSKQRNRIFGLLSIKYANSKPSKNRGEEMNNSSITTAVEEHYAAVARGEASACGAPADHVAKAVGYTAEELALAGDANLGLGCGNPLALTQIAPGMTVLDLGSGPGFDAFLAWNRVGPTGRVIGIDMTDDMLALARQNAEKRGATNVEFRKGFIEELPVESGTVDYVISNCVINLSSDKPAVFREIARVLKPGGHFAVSDIVLLKPLPAEISRDISSYVGCISGASL